MDEGDGTTLSNTNDMKESNAIPTPIIPDAFVQGAVAARDLSKVENVQKFEIQKVEQAHQHKMEEMEFEAEHHAHRYCEHVWGDSDHDGHEECQLCGLLRENVK